MIDRKKILLVEDNLELLELYKEMLNGLGHTYKALDNVIGLEETIISYQPDLLMLDIMMPDRDGIELMTNMLRQGMRLPILVISASREHAQNSEFFGASNYLIKPFSADDLMYAIDSCIENFRNIK